MSKNTFSHYTIKSHRNGLEWKNEISMLRNDFKKKLEFLFTCTG